MGDHNASAHGGNNGAPGAVPSPVKDEGLHPDKGAQDQGKSRKSGSDWSGYTEAVVTVATVVSAVATVYAVFYVKAQIELMKKSNEAAFISAQAARDSVELAKASAAESDAATRAALEIAKESLAATRESNEHTRRSAGIASDALKASTEIERARLAVVQVDPTDEATRTTEVHIRNNGRSAATNIYPYLWTHVGDRPYPPLYRSANIPANKPSVLGPGEAFSFKLPVRSEFPNAKGALYLNGHIRYDDALNRRQSAKVCYIWHRNTWGRCDIVHEAMGRDEDGRPFFEEQAK